jgi:2-amino-4-hydroxy-6-hydroxymethyldihydropteridine diphosphokinase
VYETSPVGPRQRWFLNAVAELRTALPPTELLSRLKALERRLGRKRRSRRWGPREIDLDLLFYGRRRLRGRGLVVPHARLRERKFVLRPLADLAPAFRDPVTGLTVRTLLRRLTDPAQTVRLYRRKRRP